MDGKRYSQAPEAREDQSGYIILFPVSLLGRATSVLITLTRYYEKKESYFLPYLRVPVGRAFVYPGPVTITG